MPYEVYKKVLNAEKRAFKVYRRIGAAHYDSKRHGPARVKQ